MAPGEGLLPLLQEALASAGELRDVLRREHQALAERELAGVTESARDKERLIARLEELAKLQRQAISPWVEAGTDLDEALTLPVLQGAREPWESLKTRLAECRLQNQRNGAIIELRRRFAEQLLDTLRGDGGLTRTYGPRGHTGRSDPGTPLASA